MCLAVSLKIKEATRHVFGLFKAQKQRFTEFSIVFMFHFTCRSMISTAFVDAKPLISVAVAYVTPPLVVVAWQDELEELPGRTH